MYFLLLKVLNVTKLVYFELQEVIRYNARCRQIATYNQLAVLSQVMEK